MTDKEQADKTRIDKECVHWGTRILMFRGLAARGWKINFSPSDPGFGAEGLTLQNKKEIIIHWPTGAPNYALMLHAIAHAVGGSGHDSEVFHQFQFLVTEYMTPVSLWEMTGK